MKKIKDSIRNKELLALMITIVLFFLIRVVLLIVGTKFSETREDELLHMKMDTLMEIVSDGNAKRAAADATIYANQKANVNMMTNLLKEFATKDGYAGPRVFSDGFVAELQGERVILPREYRTFDTQITREGELIREYFDARGLAGFDYAYRFPGFNKVMQAAGRLIRTTEDYGVILLMDERFLYHQNRMLFPKEWRDARVTSQATVGDDVRDFWRYV